MSLESDARFAEHVRDCANKLNDAIVASGEHGILVEAAVARQTIERAGSVPKILVKVSRPL
jgi:hypothetical protein